MIFSCAAPFLPCASYPACRATVVCKIRRSVGRWRAATVQELRRNIEFLCFSQKVLRRRSLSTNRTRKDLHIRLCKRESHCTQWYAPSSTSMVRSVEKWHLARHIQRMEAHRAIRATHCKGSRRTRPIPWTACSGPARERSNGRFHLRATASQRRPARAAALLEHLGDNPRARLLCLAVVNQPLGWSRIDPAAPARPLRPPQWDTRLPPPHSFCSSRCRAMYRARYWPKRRERESQSYTARRTSYWRRASSSLMAIAGA